MKREKPLAASIGETAALFWETFHGGDEPTAADRREFEEWIARSPEHVEAYLRTARTMTAVKPGAVRWPSTPAETLIREAKASAGEVVTIARNDAAPAQIRRPPPRVFQPRYVLAMAASLVLAIAAGWFAFMRPDYYETGFGEQRSLLLADGSRVTLNTASKIEVELRKERRIIRLVAGEALFDVAHDASRPFDVFTGDTVLRAVGTRFDVDVRPERTTVTVVEGIVAYAHGKGISAPADNSPRLHVADRVTIGAVGPGAPEHGVALDAATSWTQRKLIFDHRALGEVVEEFNRYNRARITVDSEKLRAEQITGVFQSNDPNSFVSFLSSIPGVQVRDDGQGGHLVTLHEEAAQ